MRSWFVAGVMCCGGDGEADKGDGPTGGVGSCDGTLQVGDKTIDPCAGVETQLRGVQVGGAAIDLELLLGSSTCSLALTFDDLCGSGTIWAGAGLRASLAGCGVSGEVSGNLHVSGFGLVERQPGYELNADLELNLDVAGTPVTGSVELTQPLTATSASANLSACSNLPTQLPLTTTPTKSKLDLLFVIDNSSSMYDEQLTLANSFPGMLAGIQGLTTDWQVGVTTTDTEADAGMLRSVDGVQVLTPEVPDFNNVFRQLATVGVDGALDERGRRAASMAIEAGGPRGTGLIRPEASFGVVFLSDESDYSGNNPSQAEFLQVLEELKTPPLQAQVHAIISVEPECSFGFEGQDYLALVEATDGSVVSICGDDYSSLFEDMSLPATITEIVLPSPFIQDSVVLYHTLDSGDVLLTRGADWRFNEDLSLRLDQDLVAISNRFRVEFATPRLP